MKPSLILTSAMRDVPLGLRPRLRELSLGPWEAPVSPRRR